jgi:hypothetical protein
MAENVISVAFEATADTAQAESQMAQMGTSIDGTMQQTAKSVNATADQMGKTIAMSLKQAGSTAEEAAVIYSKLGLEGGQAAQEISAAFGTIQPTADAATEAVKRTTNEIRQSTVAAMMLEQQIGLHLPRGINAMLARSELIGPALQYAFSGAILIYFAENIGEIIDRIGSAALAIGGFGEEAQKAFQEDIKASDEALVHFHGLTTQAKIATGEMLIAQTNMQLAALDAHHSWVDWEQVAKAAQMRWYDALLGPYGVVPGLKRAAEALRENTAYTNEYAKLNERLIKQIEEKGKLEEQLHNEQERGAKAAETAARQRERAEEAALKRAEAQARKVAEATAAMNALVQTELREADALAASDSKRAAALKTYEAHIQKINQTVEADRRAGTLTVEIEQAADRAKLLARQNYDAQIAKIEADEQARIDKAVTHLREQLAREAEARQREQAAFKDQAKTVIDRLAELERAENKYTARVQHDEGLVAETHKTETTAAAKHLVDEAKALATLSGDWAAYAEAVRVANKIVEDATANATAAHKTAVVESARNIASMLGMEKEFVVLEAAYMIPKNLALAFAAFGSGDFWAGMQYTMAATEWGVAAGAAVKSIVSSFGASQTSSKTAASSLTGSPSASRTSTSSGETQQQPTINVYIDGVISADKLDDVIYAINQRVTKGAVRLTSTTTIARPTVRS